MEYQLTMVETRILGALIEKDLATPEYYPLTLNALTAACNQKSNRDPVLELTEQEVQDGLNVLMTQHLVWQRSSFGSRAAKYAHKFTDTLSRAIEFDRPELAALAALMLRGPQTPGEIRARSGRMHEFAAVADAEAVLRRLANRSDGPYTIELGRQAGQRECRWAHLFSGPIDPAALHADIGEPAGQAESLGTLEARVADLESEVVQLKSIVADLKSRMGP